VALQHLWCEAARVALSELAFVTYGAGMCSHCGRLMYEGVSASVGCSVRNKYGQQGQGRRCRKAISAMVEATGPAMSRAERMGVQMAMTGDVILLGAVVFLLLAAAILMLVMVLQLRAMRREVEATRLQLAKMDWGALLLNGVQQLKQATGALDQIDKRLQKLEAIEKVQLSHINLRQGV